MESEKNNLFLENAWSLEDKLTSLKDVIKLQEIAAAKRNIAAKATCKNQAEKIKKLTKENKNLRQTLKINIRGDDLRRRTTMRKNSSYQRKFYNTQTEKIIENISEIIFNKTKKLDKLRYEKRKMEENLLCLKAQLMDCKSSSNPVKKSYEQQEILNKLQKLAEKQKAAVTVQKTYEKILKILKEDAQTYDKTLANLEADRLMQSKCILSVTEMGQNASEEFAKVREEYRKEEKQTVALMKRMDMTSNNIKSEIELITASCKSIVRTESGTRFDSAATDEDEDEDDFFNMLIGQDLTLFEEMVKELKTVTKTLTFDDVYPRIKQQIQRKIKLLKETRLKENLRDNLLDQRNQLEILLENLENSMVSTTEWYKEEKGRLTSEIKRLNEELDKTNLVIQETDKVLLKIRLSLIALTLKVDRIDTTSDYNILTERRKSTDGFLATVFLELDAIKMVHILYRKLKMLINKIKSPVNLNSNEYMRYKAAFEEEIINQHEITEKVDLYDLAVSEMLEELKKTEDPSVPSRLDIKNQSYNIIKIFTEAAAKDKHEDDSKNANP